MFGNLWLNQGLIVMSQKTIKVTGWILTALLGLLLTMSAIMKITLNETVVRGQYCNLSVHRCDRRPLAAAFHHSKNRGARNNALSGLSRRSDCNPLAAPATPIDGSFCPDFFIHISKICVEELTINGDKLFPI